MVRLAQVERVGDLNCELRRQRRGVSTLPLAGMGYRRAHPKEASTCGYVALVGDRGRHQYPGTKTGTPGVPAGYLNTYSCS